MPIFKVIDSRENQRPAYFAYADGDAPTNEPDETTREYVGFESDERGISLSLSEWLIKESTSPAYRERFRDQFNILTELARQTRLLTDGQIHSPQPVYLLERTDNQQPALALPLVRGRFNDVVGTLTDGSLGEQMLIYGRVSQALHQVENGFVCTERAIGDLQWHGNRLLVTNWRNLQPLNNESLKAEVEALGRLWYRLLMGAEPPDIPNPYNGAEWQRSAAPNTDQRQLDIGLRQLLSGALNGYYERVETLNDDLARWVEGHGAGAAASGAGGAAAFEPLAAQINERLNSMSEEMTAVRQRLDRLERRVTERATPVDPQDTTPSIAVGGQTTEMRRRGGCTTWLILLLLVAAVVAGVLYARENPAQVQQWVAQGQALVQQVASNLTNTTSQPLATADVTEPAGRATDGPTRPTPAPTVDGTIPPLAAGTAEATVPLVSAAATDDPSALPASITRSDVSLFEVRLTEDEIINLNELRENNNNDTDEGNDILGQNYALVYALNDNGAAPLLFDLEAESPLSELLADAIQPLASDIIANDINVFLMLSVQEAVGSVFVAPALLLVDEAQLVVGDETIILPPNSALSVTSTGELGALPAVEGRGFVSQPTFVRADDVLIRSLTGSLGDLRADLVTLPEPGDLLLAQVNGAGDIAAVLLGTQPVSLMTSTASSMTDDPVNVRSEPDADSEIVDQLEPDTIQSLLLPNTVTPAVREELGIDADEVAPEILLTENRIAFTANGELWYFVSGADQIVGWVQRDLIDVAFARVQSNAPSVSNIPFVAIR